MYFLQKDAVYAHGVFWIGIELDEGRKQADMHASSDRDDHHSWNLYQFVDQEISDSEYDASHHLVYTGARHIKVKT